MAELVALLGDQATDLRHQPGGDGATRGSVQGLHHLAAEDGLAFRLALEPVNRLVDHRDRRLVAFLGRVTPGEETMALENDALGVGILLAELLQPHAELETRPLPRQPADGVAEDLFCDRPGILGGGDRDDGVGMHMVDAGLGHESMQRRVDRGRARIEVEGAMGQIAHHLVLVLDAAIKPFQGAQLVHVERGEAVELDRGAVAARSLHPQHLDVLPAQRVLLPDLGRGVAATIVGDALVGAERVRAIDQKLGPAHPFGLRVIPKIGEARAGALVEHRYPPFGARMARPSFRRECLRKRHFCQS